MSHVEQYRQMTELHRRLPLFYQPWWLDAVCEEWDAVLLQEDDITGVWPFQKEKKLLFSLIRTPLLTPYLQPLLLTAGKEQVIQPAGAKYDTLLSLLPSYDYLQFQTLPGYGNPLLSSGKNFKERQRITYHIDLQDGEEILFSRIQEKRKNDIRKAEKDLSVETAPMPVTLFTRLHRQTFSRKAAPYPYPAGFLEKIVSAADKHQASLCLIARDRTGNINAILWAAYDAAAMYYLLSAADPEARHRGAVSLLIWKAICHAKEKKLRTFDFEGSMDPGIEQFFRKFGGERRIYSSLSHTPSVLWRLKQKLRG